MSRRLERGVALLTAILLVALGTMVAAAVAYHNALTARRGAATFAFEQGLLFAQGAEALAAYALKDDIRSGAADATDDRSEQWAQPYGPVEIAPGVVLEARVEDLSGRFNLNSLVQDGKVDPDALQVFQRLLDSLGLETRWAQLLGDWIDADPSAEIPDGAEDSVYLSQDPPYRPPNTYITSVSELLALPGFGRERYLTLGPHVAALPLDAKLNVCTASPFVLDAYNEGQKEHASDPEEFAKQQLSGCFPRLNAYEASFDTPDVLTRLKDRPGIEEKASYFRLTSVISIGTTRFALYSLLHRGAGGEVRVVMRSYSPD
jgi:general secretion pathway protein K